MAHQKGGSKMKRQTPETLRKLLSYDPETGALTWKWRTADLHPNDQARRAFNTQFAGKPAFTSDDGSGYMQGQILGVPHRAHRVAWAIHHGKWPIEVDHINRIRNDNRIVNLKDGCRVDNLRNLPLQKRNSSGFIGVNIHKPSGKWVAYIGNKSKKIHLGLFTDKAEAIAARKAAEVKYGYHANHGKDL
jgi:hypothetical protein